METYEKGESIVIGEYLVELEAEETWEDRELTYSSVKAKIYKNGEEVGFYSLSADGIDWDFYEITQCGSEAEEFLSYDWEGSRKFDNFIEENNVWIFMHQFNKKRKYEPVQVINVPHQMPVSVWECDSIVEAFLNDVHTQEFTSIEQAEEIFDEVPEELRKMLEYEEKVIEISECGGDFQDFISADEFENQELLEEYAERYLRQDLNNMFVLKNEKDAWDLLEYKGHKELEVQKAAREIIEKMRF